MPSKKTKSKKLDNHLTLHGWLNSHFQYKTTRDLLIDTKNVEEGFNANGHSAICELLMSCAEPNSVIEQALPTYDANIKRHLSAINKQSHTTNRPPLLSIPCTPLYRNFLGLEIQQTRGIPTPT